MDVSSVLWCMLWYAREVLPLGLTHSPPAGSVSHWGFPACPSLGLFMYLKKQPHSRLPNPQRQPTSKDRLIQEYKNLVPLPQFRTTLKRNSVLPSNWLMTLLQLYHYSISSSAQSWLPYSLTGPVAKSFQQLWSWISTSGFSGNRGKSLMTTMPYCLYFTVHRAFVTSSCSHHNSKRWDIELLLFPL